uniref:Uncharacterized protein n=1 Tax=Phytophthora ramorum TaxID=164328 RepID=H3HCP6_PHYRM
MASDSRDAFAPPPERILLLLGLGKSSSADELRVMVGGRFRPPQQVQLAGILSAMQSTSALSNTLGLSRAITYCVVAKTVSFKFQKEFLDLFAEDLPELREWINWLDELEHAAVGTSRGDDDEVEITGFLSSTTSTLKKLGRFYETTGISAVKLLDLDVAVRRELPLLLEEFPTIILINLFAKFNNEKMIQLVVKRGLPFFPKNDLLKMFDALEPAESNAIEVFVTTLFNFGRNKVDFLLMFLTFTTQSQLRFLDLMVGTEMAQQLMYGVVVHSAEDFVVLGRGLELVETHLANSTSGDDKVTTVLQMLGGLDKKDKALLCRDIIATRPDPQAEGDSTASHSSTEVHEKVLLYLCECELARHKVLRLLRVIPFAEYDRLLFFLRTQRMPEQVALTRLMLSMPSDANCRLLSKMSAWPIEALDAFFQLLLMLAKVEYKMFAKLMGSQYVSAEQLGVFITVAVDMMNQASSRELVIFAAELPVHIRNLLFEMLVDRPEKATRAAYHQN